MLIIDGFRIDAELEGDHSFRAEVTEFPVEEGIDETDNISLVPIEVTITGVVSNTPIGEVADGRANPANSSREVYEHFKRIRQARLPITIDTSLDHFENMALQDLSVPTSDTIGDVFEFTATFRQIVKKETQRSTIPVSDPAAARRKRRGKRKTIPVSRAKHLLRLLDEAERAEEARLADALDSPPRPDTRSQRRAESQARALKNYGELTNKPPVFNRNFL